MAIHKVSSKPWNGLSEDEKQKIISRLKLRGIIGESDSIEASDAVVVKELKIDKKAGCPDYCNEIAQDIYDSTWVAEWAEEEYMQCCAEQEDK